MEDINFCIKYLEDKTRISLKIIGLLIMSLIYSFILVRNIEKTLEDNLLLFFIIVYFFIIVIHHFYTIIHRLISYDEICINGDYFIVKKNGHIKSKTLISNTIFESYVFFASMTGLAYITIYDTSNEKKKLLFHYKEDEISKEEHILLKEIFKSQIKD
ncbi:hypothetical protein [Arcobacter sp. FWKO B]|uniref:hypothetical protein n=1 Tax=Arcobacter sp. FWKO B TaxID=2593672 RepID=UPI0018A5F7D2|nr:hypothetical protein [Arcobacter sp. FWKO B]QOG11540.1 hypothetical protein FWKOB_01995 [Arcobacter sp. FWKO B]